MKLELRPSVTGVLLLLSCSVAPTPARADPPWTDRLRTEGVAAWEATLAEQVFIQGTARFKITGDIGNEEYAFERKANQECCLSVFTPPSLGSQEIYGYNPQYTFHLRSQGDRGWSIVSFHPGEPGEDRTALYIRKQLEVHARIAEFGLRIPFSVEPLPFYLRGPVNRIQSVTPLVRDGVELVEIKLEIINDAKLRKITTVVDPARRWRPVHTEIHGYNRAGTCDITANYEYAPEPDGLLRRSREKEVWNGNDGQVKRAEWDRQFDLKRVKNLPDTTEFTLSAFGLPEPVGVEWPRRRSGWLWFAWAGAASVVVALVFLALKRRAARRQAAAPPTPS